MSPATQEDTIRIKLAADVDQYKRDLKDAEKAVVAHGKALQAQRRALQDEINVLKQTGTATQQEIQSRQKKIQAIAQEELAVKKKITVMREEAVASAMSAAAGDKLAAAAKSIETGMTGATVATKAFKTAVATATGILAPLIALFGAGAITKAADEYKSFASQVKNATLETKDNLAVQRELFNISAQTGVKLNSTVDVFRRISLGAKDLGKSNADAIALVSTVQKLGVIGRSSGAQLDAGLLQFGQAMATGRVYAEEFNSVVENIPLVAEAAAKGLGMSVGQMKLAVKDGEISSKQLFEAVLSNKEAVDALFASTTVTLEQGFAIFYNQLTETSAALDEATGLTDSLGKAFKDLGERLGEVKKYFNDNQAAIRGVVEVSGALLSVIGDLFNLLRNLTGGLSDTETAAYGAEGGFNSLSTKVENLNQLIADSSIRLLEFIGNIKKFLITAGDVGSSALEIPFAPITGGVNLYKSLSGGTDKAKSAKDAIDAETANSISNVLTAYGKQYPNVKAGGVSTKTNRALAAANKDKKGKTKKGPSAESLERAAVGDQKDALSAALANVALAARGAVADLGPYSSELDKLKIKQKANTDEAKVYIEALAKLRTLSGKTVEGQKERNKAIADTTRALKENGIESKETANQIRKLTDDQQKATEAYERNLRLVRSQNSTEATKNTQLFQLEELEKAFAQNQITAQEYYDERLAWIERNANIERTALLFEKGLLLEELQALGDGNETLERRRAIYLEIEKIQGRQVAIEQKRESDRENLNTKAKESAQEISDNLRDQTKNGLSEAISTVLKGGKVTDALKQFAQTLRDAIINALANALAERLVKGFQSLFDKFGAFTSKIAGNSAQTQLNPISALSGQLGTGGGLAVPQQQAGGGGGGGFTSTLRNLFSGKPKASTTAGGGTKASVGKLSGFLGKAGAGFGGGAIGAGIGQAVGAKTNKAVGAITGALGGALAGAAFGGPIGAAVGALVGGIGALFGGDGGKKQAQKQAKFDRFDAGLAKIQAGTDTNNLDSIYNSLLKITKLFKKEGGSRNLAVANQYIAQLKQAQEERKKAIAAFIKDSAQANLAVQAELDKIGKSSAEQMFLSNKVALSGLALERDKALEAYKDSQEAQTKILENYTLQRELIAKQEVESYKQNVTDLGDLLKSRDEIVNSNFFRRRQTLEQKKSQDLAAIDAQIAQSLKDLKAFQANGVAVPADLQAGLASILTRANAAGITDVKLDVIINESTNAAETQRLIENAFDGFLRSLGVNAA